MLKEYKAKRDFKNTPEPSGKKVKSIDHLRFVVQRHDATRLHYDFRLELDGVLKSWAVPKGPSMNPADKRLAVHVEDHPVDYISFQGTIPEGNYGAGDVLIWDNGVYVPVNEKLEPISERQALQQLKKGELKIFLQGNKLSGGFVLVRLHGDEEKNWLLIKHKDEYSTNRKYNSERLVEGLKPAKKKKAATKKAATKKAAKKKIAKKKKGVKQQ